MSDSLGLDYFQDDRVSEWEDNLDFVMETLSSQNSYESGEIVKENGPGLLVVQLSSDSIEEYASVMDLNPWDEEDIMYMDDDPDDLYEMFRESSKQDGAVIIGGNGRIMQSNAYLEPPASSKEEAETVQGSGAKHISASRISTLDDIVYAKALSSTTGDITTFVNGSAHKVKDRHEFNDKWANVDE